MAIRFKILNCSEKVYITPKIFKIYRLCLLIGVQNIELKDVKWQGLVGALRNIPNSIFHEYIQTSACYILLKKIMWTVFPVWRVYCSTIKQPDNNSSVLLLNQSVVWAQAIDYFPS